MRVGVILGTVLVISTSAWPLAWLGLELNLISFVPFALSEERQKKRGMNYFIIQRCGSLLLLLGGILLDNISNMRPIIILGLILKMGLIPLHFWVPGVASCLKKVPLLVLLSWQKIAPIAIIRLMILSQTWILVVNAIVGALLMINTASMTLLLVFRGMLQIAWINSLEGGFLVYYRRLYFVRLGLLIWFITRRDQNLLWALLNSGGLPPLTGFIVKLKALQRLKAWMSAVLLSCRGLALTSYSRFLVNVRYRSWLVHPRVLVVGTLGLV